MYLCVVCLNVYVCERQCVCVCEFKCVLVGMYECVYLCISKWVSRVNVLRPFALCPMFLGLGWGRLA